MAFFGKCSHVFKRSVCVWEPGDCPRCLLKSACAYSYIFETAPPPGAEKLRGLEQIPRPYVLEPPESGARQSYRPGERFDFRLVLIGRGIDYLPYFLFTFAELGRTGLNTGRGRYTVAEVLAETARGERTIYSAAENVLHTTGDRVTAADLGAPPALRNEVPRRLALHFLTPARVRTDGKVQSHLHFQDVVRALLRRLSSLCYFHCGCELSVDYKGLVEQASTIRTVESRLRWEKQRRFSGRQEQHIDMSGVMGQVVYEAADAEAWRPYLPLLAAGEWVHVGKGSVMGLGKYRVET